MSRHALDYTYIELSMELLDVSVLTLIKETYFKNFILNINCFTRD